MIDLPVSGDRLTVSFQFTELEALPCIPRPLADLEWEGRLRAQLAARAEPFAREAGAFVRAALPGPHAGILRQRADWHGGRCVLEFLPCRVFIKPKPAGAEAVVYALFVEMFQAKLGRGVEAPFRRVGDYLLQETIESTADAADARAFGLTLGLIFMAAVTDLNAENLRICRGIPLPIDVECVLDVWFYDAAPATLLRRLREQTQALRLALPDHDLIGSFSWPEFRAGFADGAIFSRDALVAALGDADGVEQWRLRRVRLPTRVYLDFIRRQTMFRWEPAEAARRWVALRGGTAADALVRAEARAMAEGNVPLFHQRGDSLLDGADGAVLECGWQPPGAALAAHAARWDDGALRALAEQLAEVKS